MKSEIPIGTLALEYLKAKYAIDTLSVKDFYKQYCEIYDEFFALENKKQADEKSESARKYLGT